MKRTLTVNLNGLAFTIDDDAYTLLQEYLQKLETHFPKEEDREILADIEQRITEIFAERLADHRQVVNTDDVNTVIETLGQPDEIDDNEGEDNINSVKNKEEKKAEKQNKRKHRRFYRDTDTCILGGVASGLAAYIGIDVTAVRILMILLLIFTTGYVIPAYLIIWMIAPAARSTSQKLEMQGIEPSIENMRKYVESEQFRESANRIGYRLGQFALWCFRILAILFGIFFGAIGILIIFAILYAIITTIALGGDILAESILPLSPIIPSSTMLATMASLALICLTIPLVFIIKSTIRLLRHDKDPFKTQHKIWNWVWFAIWILSLISLCTITTYIYINDNKTNTGSIEERRLENEPFSSISVSSAVTANLIPDTVTYIVVKGTETSLRNINTIVNNGLLHIYIGSTDNKHTMSQRPVVDVHYTDINSIAASSAASVYNRDYGTIKSDNINITTSSAAKTDLDISCKSASIVTSSAAKTKLSGDVDIINIYGSSTSKTEAMELSANNATLNATSKAKISINADTLAAQASSGAKIVYSNTPYVIYIKTNSGGSIKQD
ncbi:MAG: GIN domain-containing protein [Candidatus Aphodosoma sp.]